MSEGDILEQAYELGRQIDYLGIPVALGSVSILTYSKANEFREGYRTGKESQPEDISIEYSGSIPSAKNIGEYLGNKREKLF